MGKIKVYFYSLKGLRDQNEDTHKIIINGKGIDKTKCKINFFSIYDGHGGKHVSNMLEHSLSDYFTQKNTKYPLVKSYVNKVFDHIQDSLKNNYKEALYCGSTCLVVIQYRKQNQYYLNVLNVGDSRAVLCKESQIIPLSIDHKPNSPKERLRIEKLGGKIVNDGYDYRIKDLSVSRAVGDIIAQPYVTHRPDLFHYKLDNNDKFIVMGCDGLWDVLTNQEAVNFIISNCYDKDKKKINITFNIAQKLAEYALLRGSTDNVSVIIIIFDT